MHFFEPAALVNYFFSYNVQKQVLVLVLSF